jgi:hypothetical protein
MACRALPQAGWSGFLRSVREVSLDGLARTSSGAVVRRAAIRDMRPAIRGLTSSNARTTVRNVIAGPPLVRDVRPLVTQKVNGRQGSPMTKTVPPIIVCPLCGSQGWMIHHDIRASLLYSCKNCLREWQLDVAQEPRQPDPSFAERPGTPPPRPRKP